MSGPTQDIATNRKMVALYKGGKSLSEIGRAYGISKEAVRGRIRRAGFVGRQGRRPRPDYSVHDEFARLDLLSRERALTMEESIRLERLIRLIDGGPA